MRKFQFISLFYFCIFFIFSCEYDSNTKKSSIIETVDKAEKEVDLILVKDTSSYLKPIRTKESYGKVIQEELVNSLINLTSNQDTFKLLKCLDKELNEEYTQLKDTSLNIFKLTYYDISGDGKRELLIQYGAHIYLTKLVVFKKINQKWRCVFFNEFSHQYSGVYIDLIKISDSKRLLCLNNLEIRGSGVHKTAIYFYRMIENELIPVLRTLSTAYINGWGLFINQEVEGDFEYDPENDNISVEYLYSFYSGKLEIEGKTDYEINFASGKDILNYQWNSERYIYELDKPNDLQRSRLELFEDFGNEELFIKVFSSELRKIINSNMAGSKIIKDHFKL